MQIACTFRHEHTLEPDTVLKAILVKQLFIRALLKHMAFTTHSANHY